MQQLSDAELDDIYEGSAELLADILVEVVQMAENGASRADIMQFLMDFFERCGTLSPEPHINEIGRCGTFAATAWLLACAYKQAKKSGISAPRVKGQ